MTGEDHDADALIDALRAPALPSEGVGEDAAVSAMLEAMTTVSTRSSRRRSRRSVTIAAVTVASLGVGGLVAAGPGVPFLPAADRPPSDERAATGTLDHTGLSTIGEDRVGRAGSSRTPVGGAPTATTSTVVGSDVGATGATGSHGGLDHCDVDHHGDLVAEVARSTEPGAVNGTARSDCARPDEVTGETPADTAPGRTGDTPADTAPGPAGDTPADTAPGQTGDTAPGPTAPGQAGDTAPGQTGDTSQGPTAPGQTGDTAPGPTAPGQTGDTAPGHTAPGHTAPGHTEVNGRP